MQVEAEASDGGGSVLWLTDKSGERVRTLDRVLLGLLRHCFPLVVLRLPASLPTPSLKEKDGERPLQPPPHDPFTSVDSKGHSSKCGQDACCSFSANA